MTTILENMLLEQAIEQLTPEHVIVTVETDGEIGNQQVTKRTREVVFRDALVTIDAGNLYHLDEVASAPRHTFRRGDVEITAELVNLEKVGGRLLATYEYDGHVIP